MLKKWLIFFILVFIWFFSKTNAFDYDQCISKCNNNSSCTEQCSMKKTIIDKNNIELIIAATDNATSASLKINNNILTGDEKLDFAQYKKILNIKENLIKKISLWDKLDYNVIKNIEKLNLCSESKSQNCYNSINLQSKKDELKKKSWDSKYKKLFLWITNNCVNWKEDLYWCVYARNQLNKNIEEKDQIKASLNKDDTHAIKSGKYNWRNTSYQNHNIAITSNNDKNNVKANEKSNLNNQVQASSNSVQSNKSKEEAQSKLPKVNCIWLPWCVDKNIDKPTPASTTQNLWMEVITNLIWNLIQYVAVFAVIALMLSGIMYLISWWEEEKVKKAKSWITWSLVAVLLSTTAWWIISMVNNLIIK